MTTTSQQVRALAGEIRDLAAATLTAARDHGARLEDHDQRSLTRIHKLATGILTSSASSRCVVTVRGEGLRIGASSLEEAYRAVQSLLEVGYRLEQIEWEV